MNGSWSRPLEKPIGQVHKGPSSERSEEAAEVPVHGPASQEGEMDGEAVADPSLLCHGQKWKAAGVHLPLNGELSSH